MAKVVKRVGKWVVDYRNYGERHVNTFPNKKSAEEFHSELVLRQAKLPKNLGYTETPLKVGYSRIRV